MASKFQPSKKLPKAKPRTMEGKATRNTLKTETAKKLSSAKSKVGTAASAAKDKAKAALSDYKKKRLIKKANKTAKDL